LYPVLPGTGVIEFIAVMSSLLATGGSMYGPMFAQPKPLVAHVGLPRTFSHVYAAFGLSGSGE
jgi:hypothetical protein